MDLRTADPKSTFNENTDRFALAVLVFQLLFDGFHPYSARPLVAVGSMSTVTKRDMNIMNGISPYFTSRTNIAILEGAPDLHIIPSTLQDMFRRAFLTMDRPSSTEWQRALFDLDGNLTTCSKGHHHWRGNTSCPWCALEQKQRSTPKTPPSRPTPSPQPTPKPRPTPPPQPTPTPRPTPAPQPTPSPQPTSPQTQQPEKKKSKVWLWVAALFLLILCTNGIFDQQISPSPREFIDEVIAHEAYTLPYPSIIGIESSFDRYYYSGYDADFNGYCAEPYDDEFYIAFWAAAEPSLSSPIDFAAFSCFYSDVFAENSPKEGVYKAFFETFRSVLPVSARFSFNSNMSYSKIRSMPAYTERVYHFGEWTCEVSRSSYENFSITIERNNIYD